MRLVASQARHVAVDDRGRIVIAGEVYDNEYLLRDDLGRAIPRSPASMVDLRLVLALFLLLLASTGAGAARVTSTAASRATVAASRSCARDGGFVERASKLPDGKRPLLQRGHVPQARGCSR